MTPLSELIPGSLQKIKAIRDSNYLAWIRKQQCIKCYRKPCEAAHQRILGNGGTGIKPPDHDAVPLCHDCHVKEHNGCLTFWGIGVKHETKIHVEKLRDRLIERYEKETGQLIMENKR